MTTQSEKSRENSSLGDSPDWDTLRLQSLVPGGFGAARAYIWPRLLHLDVNAIRHLEDHKEHDPHQDERQIRLDTDRSFVLYPVDDGPEDVRPARQAELNKLIVQLFRRRPGLNYFQGFHDIATVLQLTLPPEVALYALEKLSLHRLRDSMGRTLEPLTGLMLILQRLLRLADPPYAMLLDEHAPLPYASLPHLLTLFAHAAPTLPLIQHIFDYLLVRPPVIIVYLVAAVTLTRKDQVLKIGGGSGDEGMVHSILTGLPEFIDYAKVHDDDQDQPDTEPVAAVLGQSDATPPLNGAGVHDAPLTDEGSISATNMAEPDLYTITSPSSLGSPNPLVAIEDMRTEAGTSPPPKDPFPFNEGMDGLPVPPSQSGISLSTPPITPDPDPLEPADIPLPPSVAPTPPASPIHAESSHSQVSQSLLRVLLLADELFSRFPPSTPELYLTRTLGPASVMRTWSQDASQLPSDDQAEALIVSGFDIVVRDALEPEWQEKELPQKAEKARTRKAWGNSSQLVVGAVIVLGIAVAVGVQSRSGGGGEADWSALVDTFGVLGEKMLDLFGDPRLGL